jgi:stress response protein SCP2
MECVSDIQKYNTLLQEDQVYVFLDRLDDRLDKIRIDVLQLQPFPTVEQAYAYVRREDTRQSVMLTTNGGPIASVMAIRGGKLVHYYI